MNRKEPSARSRLYEIIDKDSFTELPGQWDISDPLSFPGYRNRLQAAQDLSQQSDAVLAGTAQVGSVDCMLVLFESRFIAGSMGVLEGEKVTCAFEYASAKKLPVITVTGSGSARMQEGTVSLLQFAKIAGAVKKHSDRGMLHVSVLSNPMLGGISLSFASLADIIIVQKDCPAAEKALSLGMADILTDKKETRSILIKLLTWHCEKQII